MRENCIHQKEANSSFKNKIVYSNNEIEIIHQILYNQNVFVRRRRCDFDI